MTPKPRHIEAAKKIASNHFAREQRGECPIGWKHVQEIATALADAENRAAWDGFDRGRECYRRCFVLRGDNYEPPKERA